MDSFVNKPIRHDIANKMLGPTEGVKQLEACQASKLLIDQLVAEGTQYIFGSLGAGQSRTVTHALSQRNDVRYLAALHEALAGFMATGYTQASGRVGVLSISGAPGLAAGMPAILDAFRSRIPLVVLVEQQDSHVINDDPPLAADMAAMVRPVCKWACEARSSLELPRLIRRAFHEALSAPRGPVLLSLPINVLFENGVNQVIPPPQASPAGAADTSFLKKVAKALIGGRNPCLILGNEVSMYRARSEVVALVEVLGCPAFIEPMPTGVSFPNRHALFAGVLPTDLTDAHSLLLQHDVVLILGMQNRMPARAHEPPLIPPSSYVIQINVEPGLAGRTLPCHLLALADIGESVSRLRAELQLLVDSKWLNEVKHRYRRVTGEIGERRRRLEQSAPYPKDTEEIPLFWLLRILDAIRPGKSVIVNDLVSDRADPFQLFALESSSSYFSSLGCVSGHSLGAALGVKFASPDHSVICLTSDQSLLQYPQAFWTATHYGLPVKFVVANSRGLNSYTLPLIPYRNPALTMPLDNPRVSVVDLAAAFSTRANTVTAISQLEPAFKAMFDTDGPYLLNVAVKPEPDQF